MADDSKIPVTYSLDPKSGDIHRKMGKGNEIIEDLVVAHYDAKKRIITFPNGQARLKYFEGVTVFCASNEFPIRHFKRADLKADKEMDGKDIPPRPKKQDINGNKTAEIVDWYLRYQWNEFCTLYGFRGTYTGKVSYLQPTWVARPGDGQPEYRGQQRVEKNVTDAIVTDQKTHRSFLPSECVEWSDGDGEEASQADGPMLAARALLGHTHDEEVGTR